MTGGEAVAAKGKWAQGITPRNFAWVIKDRFAVCERPGGYGTNHRRVRRQEEIIWVREQGFGPVVSIIPSTANLHSYTELGVEWLHRPFGPVDEPVEVLGALYPELRDLMAGGRKLLLHGEELGDRIAGLIGGYLVWSGMVPDGPKATAVVERLLSRSMGPAGRGMVQLAPRLPGAAVRG
ncbi:MAG: hypothetical protein HYX34_14215 [Actinobacteria bacterium]|nr:hypothetical protein [Actinomycetota bacterium]